MKITHIAPIAATALATTFSLFYLMQQLIASDEVLLEDTPILRMPVFILPPSDPPVVRVIEHIPEPVTVMPPPPPPPGDKQAQPGGGFTFEIGSPPQPQPPTDLPPLRLGQIDGMLTPLVRVQPDFPIRCQERGLSGVVVVEFDIDAYGAVLDPRILNDGGTSCFNRSALRAISRFKYKPAVTDGQPQAAYDIQFRIVFEIDGEQQ